MAAVGDDYIYIFGHKYDISYPGSIIVDEAVLSFKDENELQRKLKRFFLNYVSNRTVFYEREMACPHYLVTVRQMKSRYGSNNKPKRKSHTHSCYSIIRK